jgi:hypothetical protein
MGNEMTTSGQMGAPAPAAQRQSESAASRKTTQAGEQPRNGQASVQQGGDSTAPQITDWASI